MAYVPVVVRGVVFLIDTDKEYYLYDNYLPNKEGQPYIFESHVDAIEWVFKNVKEEVINKNHSCFSNVNPTIYRSWYLKDPNTP